MSNDDNIKQYTATDIERYINRQMPAGEMHALEKAALDDPFLADAIEGFGDWKPAEGKLSADVKELQGRLKQRIAQKGKVVPLHRSNWWWIAAAMMIITATGTIVYTMVADSHKSDIAKNESLPKEGLTNDSSSPAPSAMQDAAKPDMADNKAKLKTRPDDILREREQALKKESIERSPGSVASGAKPAETVTPDREEKREETDVAARALFPAPAPKDAASAGDSINADTALSFNGVAMQQKKQASNQPMAARKGKADVSRSLPVAQTDSAAVPVIDWTNYQEYIEKNKRVPPSVRSVHGTVILSFMVSETGDLTDFTIERPLSVLLDQEAIRLVKQGPAWKPREGKKAKALISIRF